MTPMQLQAQVASAIAKSHDLCGAIAPDPATPFVCSRPAGHDGEHQAVDTVTLEEYSEPWPGDATWSRPS